MGIIVRGSNGYLHPFLSKVASYYTFGGRFKVARQPEKRSGNVSPLFPRYLLLSCNFFKFSHSYVYLESLSLFALENEFSV